MRRHQSRFWVLSGAIMLGLILWGAAVGMLTSEHTLSTSIPIFLHRWLVVDLSYRRLDADTAGWPDLHTFRELRVRAGTEDTATDTYHSLVDVTLPIWPLPMTDGD